jgi:hypothetical protein
MSIKRSLLLLSVWSFLFFLAACMQLPDTDQPPLDSTREPSKTPTIVWFPPTETPTLTPVTATLTPTAEQRPNLGAELLSDDFTRPALWLLGRFDGGSIALGLNEISMAVSSSEASLATFRQEPTFSDFYYEATASPNLCAGRDAYGLIVRAVSTTDFYAFLLSCDGVVRMERDKVSERIPLQDWTPVVGQVTPDIGGATRLGVWVLGREMRFFVNDVYQFTVADPAFPRGLIGFYVRSAGTSALTVNFSQLVVREISGIPPIQITSSPTEKE